MADGRGGYRAPSKPAHVSGPGKYAKRTDGQPTQVLSAPPGMDYGDRKDMLNSERIAPMGGQAPLPAPPSPGAPGGAPQGGAPAAPGYQGGPLDAPTARPGEPISAGAPLGAGPGPEVLNMPGAQGPQVTGSMTPLLQRYAATDATGAIGQLLQAANAHGV